MSERVGRPVRAGVTRTAALNFLVSAIVALLAAGLLGALALWMREHGHDPAVLIHHPAHLYGFWPFAGLVSHLGVFAMGATGTICLFASLHAGRDRELLRAIGALSILLATDDFFMLHDYFWPRRGVPGGVVIAVYFALGAAIALAFRRSLAGWQHVPLGVGAGLMTLSLLVDATGPKRLAVELAEDAFKFAGILIWSGYWLLRAHAALADRPARQPRFGGIE